MNGNQPWYRRPVVQAAALFVFSCLLYANTLGHDFALDDAIVITENSVVQRGPAGWGDLFTHDSFYGFFDERDRSTLVTGGRYRPLTLAMFSLERLVSDGPFVHHLFNVLWYAALVVIVFVVLRRMGGPWWLAPAAAALFAAHPLHTEAVANIKGRDEIVALCGALGALFLILRAAEEERFWGGVAGAVIFLLGCLAKENALTFVAVIPLFVYAFVERGYRHLTPLLVATVLYLVLRTSVIGWGGGEPPLEWMNNPFMRPTGAGEWEVLTFWERQPTVLYTLFVYLKLLVLPVGLVHDYYPAAISLKSWSDPVVLLSLAIHVTLLVWSVWHLRSRHKLIAVGMLTYLLTLSVVSNVFFSVGTLMSERFLFMPSFGFVLAAAGLAAVGTRKVAMLPWIVPAVILVFSVLTVSRNPVWKDNYTLFTTDVVRQPRSAKLRNAAGGARLDRYQMLDEDSQAGRSDLLRDALRDLDEAIRIHPAYYNAYLLRGNARLLLKDYDGAIEDYRRASQLNDTDDVRKNLVIALQRAGRAAGEERQDFPAALGYLEQADQLRPNDYETLRLLGIASAMSGQLPRAAEYFRRALERMPENAGALRNYATALHQLGRVEEAGELFRRADSLDQ
ncbi:tetratricopeptide repeat protein [Lewinella sp. JB7]|uniref:tetratricopeptide repeat protein n=1 Tax=Lewinella sp. JB7 TaxID=2962887 RepID=UPI0020C9453E|nr:tetratricopeptide repeat protein [Lewinella sp. JB7]MCP9236066.1 tetratricopeptide repeat protein [Lewinella sp. JB7]